MQKINLIAQSVLKLSHRENADDNDDNDDDDTHLGWIIVRVGRYSVADKNEKKTNISLIRLEYVRSKLESPYRALLLRFLELF